MCVANGISPANLVHDDNGQLTYLLTFSIIMGPNHLLFDDYVFVRPHFLSCHHYYSPLNSSILWVDATKDIFPKGLCTNHVDRILGIFDPPPPPWTLLQNSCY